jgi:hypothetical protein
MIYQAVEDVQCVSSGHIGFSPSMMDLNYAQLVNQNDA